MRYYIKEHLRFKLKRPRIIKKEHRSEASEQSENISIKKAYERKDREPRLKVNVLIMAKNKNKTDKNSRVTAGDLMKRIGRSPSSEVTENEEFVEEKPYDFENSYESIDVSSNVGFDESDSDLDINELLKKYMPEYESENDYSDSESDSKGGVISRLRGNGTRDIDNEESLINALDSAFETPEESEYNIEPNDRISNEKETICEYDIEEREKDSEYDENVKSEPQKGFFSFFSRKKAEAPVYETDEYEDDAAEYYGKEIESAEAADEYYSSDISDKNVVSESEETESGTSDVGEENNIVDSDSMQDNYDPTDINLMIAFGLDGENGDKADKAKALGDKFEERQNRRDIKSNKLDHPEFVDKTQIPTFRKEFASKSRALWIKFAICLVFTAVLLIFENITALTKLFTGSEKQFAGVFDPAVYPVVYIMTSLQLMLLACVCAFDQIVDGFKFIFRGIPRPESMTALLTIAGIVYSAVLSRVIASPTEPVMFNFVVALSALLTLVYAIYNNKRELMNFKIIANKKTKHIMRRLLDEESEGEARAFADADDICDVMKIEKTDFIDGFFGRLSKSNQNTNTFMTFLMSISLAIAILFGIFMNFKGGDAATVCKVIYSSMLIIAPMSIYLTFSYPFYRANLAAREYDSAIIGENSLEEYSNASIISFDDKNVFPSYSVKVQNIRIYNNARIDRVLYYASSVFAYAGGPLQDVFEIATKDMGNSDNVKIFDTEAGFLATQVDGVNIIFGNREALAERGLEIPDSAAEDDVDLSDELSIMYMFRESKLVAKMYIKYVMDADIDLILKQFSGNGLYVCVRTFDPNIDERMIAKKLNMRRMPLKIVRYSSADEVGMYEEKVDSGLVTCGSPKSLLQIVSYCGKVLHTKKTNIALSVLSVMISVAILLLLTLSNSLDSLSSLFIAVYQLIWLIPMIISSKIFIR